MTSNRSATEIVSGQKVAAACSPLLSFYFVV